MPQAYKTQVSSVVSKIVGVPIDQCEYAIGTWGNVDLCADLGGGRLLLLEIEGSGQKHPDTNVLKIWPFLEDDQRVSVILIQAFLSSNPVIHRSRGRLCTWLGEKMRRNFGNRFRYVRLIVSAEDYSISEGAEALRSILQLS